jgi:hypothetical protein
VRRATSVLRFHLDTLAMAGGVGSTHDQPWWHVHHWGPVRDLNYAEQKLCSALSVLATLTHSSVNFLAGGAIVVFFRFPREVLFVRRGRCKKVRLVVVMVLVLCVVPSSLSRYLV